jgi:hypothetical protein
MTAGDEDVGDSDELGGIGGLSKRSKSNFLSTLLAI